ncbi:MAG: sensor domain-containing diguanylate cyclase [Acidobacteriota bacterium]
MPETDRSLRELRQHADLMEMLSQVSRVALEEENLSELLQSVVRYIAERLPVGVASILLVDATCENFVTEVCAGDLVLVPPNGSAVWPVTMGACGRCARTGEAQLISDTANDFDYLVGNPAVRSEYITPIRFRGQVLGVLNLESTREDTFTEYARQVFDQLAVQVAGAIRMARVNETLEGLNRELGRLSHRDSLTGLANRRRFDEALAEESARVRDHGGSLSLLLADLDHFKVLNDERGHLHGDDCLRRVALALEGALARTGALVARFGGEEFGVVLPGLEIDGARAVAERLRLRVLELDLRDGRPGGATISIGVAAWTTGDYDPETLVQRADGALYRAKSGGRNRVEIS